MPLESTIQAAIIRAGKKRGAWVVNVHGSAMGRRGVPDLIFCYRGMFVAPEVKKKGGKVAPIQRYEIRKIKEAGGFTGIVTSVTEFLNLLDQIDDLLDD